MSGLDFFALFVLLVLMVTALAAVVFLGSWPGKVAEQRNHRHREAIKVGGWVTLFAGGFFWPLILIWSFMEARDPVPLTIQNGSDQLGENSQDKEAAQ